MSYTYTSEKEVGIVFAHVRTNAQSSELAVFGDPFWHMEMMFPETIGKNWSVLPHFKVGPVMDFSHLRPIGVYGILAED